MLDFNLKIKKLKNKIGSLIEIGVFSIDLTKERIDFLIVENFSIDIKN